MNCICRIWPCFRTRLKLHTGTRGRPWSRDCTCNRQVTERHSTTSLRQGRAFWTAVQDVLSNRMPGGQARLKSYQPGWSFQPHCICVLVSGLLKPTCSHADATRGPVCGHHQPVQPLDLVVCSGGTGSAASFGSAVPPPPPPPPDSKIYVPPPPPPPPGETCHAMPARVHTAHAVCASLQGLHLMICLLCTRSCMRAHA